MAGTAPADRTELPVACNLGVFSREEAVRHDRLTKEMQAARLESRTLPEGWAVRFPEGNDWLRTLADWIALESRCCPFLTFDLRVDRRAVWLTVTAEGEARRFLLNHSL